MQYHRRWKLVNVDGGQLDLNKEIDVTDRRILSVIDFKKEIFDYFLLIHNNFLLRQKIREFTHDIAQPTIKLLPYSIWTNWSQYWTRADSRNKYPKDFFYEVDLTYDPVSVEERSFSATNLPHEQAGRLVVYKKAKNKAPKDAKWMYGRTDYQIRLQDEVVQLRGMA